MVAAVGVLVLAIGLLAFFSLTGWGIVRLLAPGLSADVTAALAPVSGVAAFSTVAAFLVPWAPIELALSVAVGLPLLALAVALPRISAGRRRGRATTWAALASVALVGLLGASLPSFVHDAGAPATWGNADPYLWVSQAKSLLSGPPPAPETRYPDRVAYDDLSRDGWAPGLPALTAVGAVVAHEDPVDVFGAVAALIFALTPLVSYALARLTLAWSFRLSATAAAVVALSPYRLYSSYYGWQPQLAGVACLLGAVMLFRAMFDGAATGRRLSFLAALLVSGALGFYRLPFLPYLIFAMGLVIAGYLVTGRRNGWWPVRAAARPTAQLLGAATILAAPSVVDFLRHAGSFWRGEDDAAAWGRYVRGLPSDALGLLPRAPTLAYQPPGVLKVAAFGLSLVVLASGLRALRRDASGQRDLVASLCVGSLAALLVAQLPMFTPYFSIKLDAYGTVPMILTALAPLEGRRLPPRKLVVGGALVLLSLAAVVVAGRVTVSAATSESIAAETAALPLKERVTIGFRNSWKQMWAIYFTRDHPASIVHPSDYLTAIGLRRSPCAYLGALGGCRGRPGPTR
jgi:hypothetical protein